MMCYDFLGSVFLCVCLFSSVCFWGCLQNPVMDGMDDFGIDLYALPEPMPNSSSRIDADENSRIAAMVNNTASEWQRYMLCYFFFSASLSL